MEKNKIKEEDEEKNEEDEEEGSGRGIMARVVARTRQVLRSSSQHCSSTVVKEKFVMDQ